MSKDLTFPQMAAYARLANLTEEECKSLVNVDYHYRKGAGMKMVSEWQDGFHGIELSSRVDSDGIEIKLNNVCEYNQETVLQINYTFENLIKLAMMEQLQLVNEREEAEAKKKSSLLDMLFSKLKG
jgi:hypothetical protein